MILVARTQTEKQMERKIIGGEKNIKKKLQYLLWTAMLGMDGKEIVNSPLNKFLILALKIYS